MKRSAAQRHRRSASQAPAPAIVKQAVPGAIQKRAGTGLPRRRMYFGVDIEAAGARKRDSVIAVGLCLSDTTWGVLIKKRIVLPPPYRFEKRCVDQFWSKNEKLLQELTAEGTGAEKDVLRTQLNAFLSEWEPHTEGDAPEDTSTYNGYCALVTDNPDFDVARLDDALESVERDHTPMHYTRAGQYRPVMDPSERIEAQGLAWAHLTDFLASINVAATHKPEDDAEVHVWMLFLSMAYARLQALHRGTKTLAAIEEEFYALLKAPKARDEVLRLAHEQEEAKK